MSREDIKYVDPVHSTAQLIGNHYSIDLPFREENPVLPDNRCVAEQCLQNLKRNFVKNVPFKEECAVFLNDVIIKGYAEMVPPDQLKQSDGKVWCIPHHGVYHPRKGKLRVVF